ncbi:protease secretion system outer membrane protein [Paraburkholderia sp. WSM4175]|uniref:TolC family outer membrane protein n=1 Tax=Paraburkholderia sp. WSM4175 TaxID=2991072 RepID=UPI003D19EC1E
MQTAMTRTRDTSRGFGHAMAQRSRPRGVAIRIGVLIVFTLGPVQASHALGLADAYEAALQHDPLYAAAAQEKAAGDANRAIGRSYLLPSLSANYANYRDWTRTTYLDSQNGNQSINQTYHAYSAGVSLRQPLINYEGLARYRYGKAVALASDATFDDRGEDLLVRVLTAYTDTVFAFDQLALASAQTTALDEQLAVNEAMLRSGEGTRTDVLETRAKLELARSDVADAQDSLDNAAHALDAVTGVPLSADVAKLDRLSDAFQPSMPSPAGFEQWRDIALDSNAELIAERHTVEAARQQLEVVHAGFYPHVDLVASIGQNQSNTVDIIGQRYFTKAAGIEVTIPLYSGGLVRASSEQASANYQKTQFELQDETNKVLLELRKQYNLCVSSLSRIRALQSAVDSATLLITATHKSVQAGTRTNFDVLSATQQLYQARRDLARARYQYMIANLSLRHAAGILTAQDLYETARWFTPPGALTPIAKAGAPAPVARQAHAM